jgi:hypothetical protein
LSIAWCTSYIADAAAEAIEPGAHRRAPLVGLQAALNSA